MASEELTSFRFQDDSLLVSLSDIDHRLRVKYLLPTLSLRGHLQLELLFDFAVRRVKVLYFKSSTVDAPFLQKLGEYATA